MYRIFSCNHAGPFLIYLSHDAIKTGFVSGTLGFDRQWSTFEKRNAGDVPPGLILAIGLATLAVLDAGCSSSAQPKAPAPAEVSVAEVICKQIGDSDEFTGRLEAVNAVEVRPRVSGYLQSVHFKEGAIVRQGELLFQIDPRPFQAEVDRLKGDLSQAKAQRSRAQSDFERAERLHNNDGMSAEEYDRRAAVRNEAEARIASTEATLRGAELNLEFTRVTAPITGRVGRAEITEGNLVESGAAQIKPLTTLVSLDPIYVYFDVDEQTYLKYARLTQSHRTSSRDVRSAALLGLADEDGFPHVGQVSFVDNQVSSSTGTIRLRATFANKNLALCENSVARRRGARWLPGKRRGRRYGLESKVRFCARQKQHARLSPRETWPDGGGIACRA